MTDEHISALNEHVDGFRAADDKAQEHIIGELISHFKSACPQGDKLDSKAVENVRTPSAALSHSQTFLAYSPAHLSQNQVGSDTTRFRNQSGSWRKVRTLSTN